MLTSPSRSDPNAHQLAHVMRSSALRALVDPEQLRAILLQVGGLKADVSAGSVVRSPAV